MFATHKFWWHSGEKHHALANLTDFLETIQIPGILPAGPDSVASAAGPNAIPNFSPPPVPNLAGQTSANLNLSGMSVNELRIFRVKCLLKRAEWMRELGSPLEEVLATVMEARELSPDHYSVWHAWAVTNYDQLKKVDSQEPVEDVTTANLRSFSTLDLTPQKSIIGAAGGAPDHRRSFTPTDGLVQTKGLPGFLRLPGIGGPTPARGRISRALSSGTLTLANLLSVQQVDQVTPYVVEAIKGFVHSIVLGQGQPLANILQDTLRLLTLWFSYGTKEGVYQILTAELDQVSTENWLSVIPQLIARMHVKAPQIAVLLRKLLMKVASTHPQALVCPISVAQNTHDKQQKTVATELVNEMRKRRSQLVEEATMLSRELIRVAITPHELWHDGLEKAAQLYMENRDIRGMMDALTEMHDTMNESAIVDNKVQVGFTEDMSKVGHTTLRDVSFRHSYGRPLAEALDWLEMFKKSNRTTDLHQAWEIYQLVFKKIKAQIKTFKNVELHHVSPALTSAVDLKLAVPGTYRPNVPVISISGFSASIEVIPSKQRPRRMSMLGSDGNKYQFLLKGHEDLRQDERVMQLFGLINVCLDNDRTTGKKGLDIQRYSVLPLSNNSGVIGWVENCDTLNQLVKQYRESKDMKLGIEVKLLQNKSLNYDKLPLLGKVEVFRQVMEETTGEDLAKMLWLKSKTADVWVERRANFTRSCAVMSMAGYILGLGDRHPSNLMLDRVSGQVVHIDFGDCFEITKQRSKYPEIIPFRLTRMMTTAMGQSGIAGTYRLTCERVRNSTVQRTTYNVLYYMTELMRILHNFDSISGLLLARCYFYRYYCYAALATAISAAIITVSKIACSLPIAHE
jgi:FKBP12-rapamycin complex-associated protein